MAIAFFLIAGFMGAEVAGGLLTGSLALLADAAHMLSDAASLALALGAMTLALRPADQHRTYGLHRMEVLAAFVNGLALLVLAAWIVAEAIPRLIDPQPVMGAPMMAVAALGLVVNVVAWRILSRSGHSHSHGGHGHGSHGHGGHGHGGHSGHGQDLNTRAAAAHVMGDLLGSVAALAAAGIIMLTGWTPIDPLLSMGVALLIARSGYAVVRESGNVLVEGAPAGLRLTDLADDLAGVLGGGAQVHHLHAWSLTPERPLVTFHLTIHADADPDASLSTAKDRLVDRWGVRHSVIQVERASCPDHPGSCDHIPAPADDGRPPGHGQDHDHDHAHDHDHSHAHHPASPVSCSPPPGTAS